MSGAFLLISLVIAGNQWFKKTEMVFYITRFVVALVNIQWFGSLNSSCA